MWALWVVLALVVAGAGWLLYRHGTRPVEEIDEPEPEPEPPGPALPHRCAVYSPRDKVAIYEGDDPAEAKRYWHAERSHAELWIDGIRRGRPR